MQAFEGPGACRSEAEIPSGDRLAADRPSEIIIEHAVSPPVGKACAAVNEPLRSAA